MTKTLKLQSKPRSWQAREALMTAIRDRVPFTTSGSLSGETVDMWGVSSAGRLEGADLKAFHADNDAPCIIDYVVMSYATPIAWHRMDGTWHVVAQSFSITTGCQQGIIRQAVGSTTSKNDEFSL